jgi:hypothetical protein
LSLKRRGVLRREKTLEEELAAAKQSAEEREAALREEAAEAKQSAEERRAGEVAAVEAERDDFIAQCGALSGAKRNTKKCLFWIAAKKPTILPSQARDKHQEKLRQRDSSLFSQAVWRRPQSRPPPRSRQQRRSSRALPKDSRS